MSLGLTIPAPQARLPGGLLAVPMADDAAAAMRICLVLRDEDGQARPIDLRSLFGARALLGCLMDRGQVVHEWLEIWIQHPASDAAAPSARVRTLDNSALDRRFSEQLAAFERLDPDLLIRTGFEQTHPLPLLLDVKNRQAVHPRDGESGQQWQLCTDEGLLKARNLVGYATTGHRYLFIPELGEHSPFVAATPGAPGEGMSPQLPGGEGLVPVNVHCGRIIVRRFSPVDLEAYCNLLAGITDNQAAAPRLPVPTNSSWQGNGQALPETMAGDGYLHLGPRGRGGRLLESFHLRLRAIWDATFAVASVVREQQRPLLNLSPESFQVYISAPGGGLPAFWTARTSLVDGGVAVEVPVPNAEFRCFLPASEPARSIYQPDAVLLPISGTGTLRIRQVLADGADAAVIEATFATAQRLQPRKSDLVILRLALPDGAVDLYGTLEAQQALAAGEWRFRSLNQRHAAAQLAQLKELAGVPVDNVAMELLPQVSTPADLHALGVLMVQLLLAGPGFALPLALDETLSLARQVAEEHDSAIPLSQRVGAVFGRDPRWLEQIGPHRLAAEDLAPGDALDLVPPEIWHQALAMVIRTFAGVGRDSICLDYGDAPAGALHRVFEPVLAELQSLLMRTRSLILIDWKANREIHAVIRGHMAGLAPRAAAAGR